MMKAYVAPPGHLSQAMFRVSRALARYAPSDVEIVTDPSQADFHVLHVVSRDAIEAIPNAEYGVIQYCYQTAGIGDWLQLWDRSKTVWSYYDLHEVVPERVNFYHAPLGVDPEFTRDANATKEIGILTSGYVTGHVAEAIEEVVDAAARLNMSVVHLGPPDIAGMARVPANWRNIFGVSDAVLADHYRQCQWVSGLRHVEGFELPVIEGLACGARPIVFDRPEMRYWYDGHAVFLPECAGPSLVNHLVEVLAHGPDPVSSDERVWVTHRFDWQPIVEGFWERVL